jgi:hypothetical protein
VTAVTCRTFEALARAGKRGNLMMDERERPWDEIPWDEPAAEEMTGSVRYLPLPADYAPEAAACMPLVGPGCIIGSGIPGVNDEGARLSDFKPTLHELGILAVHYEELYQDTEFCCTAYEYSGSSESRRMAFAGARLASIQKVLGEEAFEKAVTETRKRWKAQWEKFAADMAAAKCAACDKPAAGYQDAGYIKEHGRCYECAEKKEGA